MGDERYGGNRIPHSEMKTTFVEDREQIRLAMTVSCPVCSADIGCLCDQFQSPHDLPFHVHVERYEAAVAR